MFHYPASGHRRDAAYVAKGSTRMSLGPDQRELVLRAIADLRIGVPTVLTGADSALVAAAETLSPERLHAMHAMGGAYLAITRRRADVLRAMVYDGDIARIALPQTVDMRWIRAMADPSNDLDSPMKGPFQSLRGGDPELSRQAIGLCKAARLLPAALICPVADPISTAQSNGLHQVEFASESLDIPTRLRQIARGHVPLSVSKNTVVHVFADGAEEHYAIEIGRADRELPVLARLHSACFTGDLLGSLKCDCGAQLRAALRRIADEGSGVLLYLNQEGRGIGLANKLRAYSLQDQGFDTVEANHRLGFEDDERDFRIGADILRQLGFKATRLMTNNPAKVDRMQETGIQVVERVAHKFGETPENAQYLATKAAKSGHVL